jgi:hypothetical protein
VHFEELNPQTRKHMLDEFRSEQRSANPYRPKVLTPDGEAAFVGIMEEHLTNGTESTLMVALSEPKFWVERGVRNTKKGPVPYFLPAEQRAKVFALTDFNTWYVRALCRILIEAGITDCEGYRAEVAYEPRGECSNLEGLILSVEEVYRGHRARYYPEETKNPDALSIPVGPNCHHSIRRRSGR